jgi:hypothetical protein
MHEAASRDLSRAHIDFRSAAAKAEISTVKKK